MKATKRDYLRAFEALPLEKVHPKKKEMLRYHLERPDQTVTWEEMAKKVRYKSRNPVQLHYGKLARRIAEQLNMPKPEEDFWLFVLVKWAPGKKAQAHTRFTLRQPVVQALRAYGPF